MATPGMMSGMLFQGQMGGDPQQRGTETSVYNPSGYDPNRPTFDTMGITEDDQKTLVDTITDYRGSWAQDRLERLRQWQENVLYWKGVQVIRWDAASNAYYDVLAWARQNDSGEDTDLERWINPLTLMFCNVFTSTMSRAVPEPIVKPQNANPELKDTVTAKAAVDALRIIGRQNEKQKLNRSIYEMLFLFGSYFRYTRAVQDQMFGCDEVAQYEDMEIQNGPHYRCPSCGTETPASDGNGMACPNCGSFMGQESYFAAGEGNRTSLRQSDTLKVPRSGVKWSLHSPMEIDCDPTAKGDRPLKMTPLLAKDVEVDFGEMCMLFPKLRETLQPGAESSTTPNAAVEKMTRLNAVSALGGNTADNGMQKPTLSEVWMKPQTFYRMRDFAFGDRMKKMFPEGLKLTMVGPTVVDIRKANLEREWSHAALYSGQGIYCAALANTAVSFNARFNRTMWIIDDWAAKASTGLNLADASRIDTEKMSGKQIPSGTIIPLPMKIAGDRLPLLEAFGHFDLPLNPALWNYPQMLMTFAELIMGIPRQLSGQGTQDDVETLGGQQLQLTRAATTLKPYFENVKDEDAQACQNAIECLKELMKAGEVNSLLDVIESQGGAFENNEIDWNQMQGNVAVYVDEDQDLPIAPEALQAAIQMMFQELSKGNPAAIAWFDVPENQDLAESALVPGSVVPDNAQRLKTESDFQTVMTQPMQPMLGPNGAPTSTLPVHPEKWEDFTVAKKIWQRSMNEHFQMRIDNPSAWVALNVYSDELEQAEMQAAQRQAARQLSVTQAGSPPPPQPDPAMQGEMQQLVQAAQLAIAKLAQFAQVDPMLTGGTMKDQIAASKEILDTTVDGAKLMNGGK